MYICANCGVEMECIKNGMFVDYGGGHVYHADLHQCAICGASVAKTAPVADFLPDYVPGSFDVKMVEGDH